LGRATVNNVIVKIVNLVVSTDIHLSWWLNLSWLEKSSTFGILLAGVLW
jgi:hypothetical protein